VTVDKELFQGDMKIMQKPGIIDNPGTIDITETNDQLLSEGHIFFPLNTFFNSLYPDFCHSPTVFRPLSSVFRPLSSDPRHLKLPACSLLSREYPAKKGSFFHQLACDDISYLFWRGRLELSSYKASEVYFYR
jgi:hypothetical protein